MGTQERLSAVDYFLVTFPSILLEALPFIILGALISGALEELLPQQLITKIIPKRRWLAIAGSSLLGLVFPMCECGIVPVMRRLLGKGLPLSCAVAYMLAAPIINPVVIASTTAAFSGDRSGLDGLTSLQIVSLRVGLGFLTAFIVGMIVLRAENKYGVGALIRPIHGAKPTQAHGADPAVKTAASSQEAAPATQGHHVHDASSVSEVEKKTITQRLFSISETALHDFVDITCFLILGVFVASLFQTFNVLQYAREIGQNPAIASLTMMAMAILLCLCSEADAFVAANLDMAVAGKTMIVPLAGKLSFLVLGPMLDLKLYMMYTRVFRRRLIWTIIPSVVGTVFVLSLITHYTFEWLKTYGWLKP